MSNRQSILAALAQHGTSTYDDLEKSTDMPRNKLRWTCHDLKKIGYIAQTEDAITREVAWKITPAGRHALASENPGDDMQQTPAGGGEITPAAAHPARRVATGRKRTASLPEGAANPIEPATRDETPAAPGSGHDGGRIAADIIGSLENEVAALRKQLNEWNDMAWLYDLATPGEVAEYITAMTQQVRQIQDDLENSQKSPSTAAETRYAVAEAKELFETPEEALAAALEYNEPDLLESCIVIAGTIAGKVSIKAVMEPVA